MTYCVGITVDRGLVLASDSRTNAGVDQVSTYSKMHTLCDDGERMMTLLSAGNLATSQSVVRHLRHDLEEKAARSLKTAAKLAEAAEYVGEVSVTEQHKHVKRADESFKPEASFILAGQIRGQPHQIYLIYPEGNYIRPSGHDPFLQIGESKYGKPILDRIIEPASDLETAARCALVSMDSTMQSNVTVGPPIELMIYDTDTCTGGYRYSLGDDDEYLRALRIGWQDEIKAAFAKLPRLPTHEQRIRLVDGPGEP